MIDLFCGSGVLLVALLVKGFLKKATGSRKGGEPVATKIFCTKKAGFLTGGGLQIPNSG